MHVGDGSDHHALLGQPGAASGDGQIEVADLGETVFGEPDVTGFEVPMDDAPGVGELLEPVR